MQMLIAAAALLCFGHRCMAEIVQGVCDQPESADPTIQRGSGQAYSHKPGEKFYGNNVVPRSEYINAGPRKSFIDVNTRLPDGILLQFFFHTQNVSTTGTTAVRLQIWRHFLHFEINEFQLVWEKRVEVTLGGRGLFYTVTFSQIEGVQTKAGDYFGWTVEDSTLPLSSVYGEKYHTFLRKVEDDRYPVSGQRYTFNPLSLPAMSSVGVRIAIPGVYRIPGGFYIPSSGSQFYGNSLTLGTDFLPTKARKTWIDVKTLLPSGILLKYYIYIHNVNKTSKTGIRLQIWRLVSPGITDYQLVWEKRIETHPSSSSGAMHMVMLDVTERFQTKSGDIIGWTYENNTGLISVSYMSDHVTYFRSIHEDYPLPGASYSFSQLSMDKVFSVGVEIVRCTDDQPEVSTDSSNEAGPNGDHVMSTSSTTESESIKENENNEPNGDHVMSSSSSTESESVKEYENNEPNGDQVISSSSSSESESIEENENNEPNEAAATPTRGCSGRTLPWLPLLSVILCIVYSVLA